MEHCTSPFTLPSVISSTTPTQFILQTAGAMNATIAAVPGLFCTGFFFYVAAAVAQYRVPSGGHGGPSFTLMMLVVLV